MPELFLVGVLLFLSAIILLPRYFRHRERRQLNETLQRAIEKGETVPPQMIEVLTADNGLPSPQRDLRYGIILICVAASMGVMGWTQYVTQYVKHPERPIAYIIWAAASLPGFIGLAFIIFGLTGLSKPPRRA
ncbi:MAG: hypothetical protein JWM33_1695 [Caulobacteraceae bacterium]|nr:hypothetical protein [Caulobacteraceae bacterium]